MGLTGNTQIKFMQLHGNLPGRLVFGVPGKNGVTFTPHVSEDGILSWTNDGGLENPAPVKIPGGSADPEAIEKAIEEYLAANPLNAADIIIKGEGDNETTLAAKLYEIIQSLNSKVTEEELKAAVTEAMKDLSLPSKTSDLTNDSGFITRAVQDLENYYRKSETYTREEIDQKISAIPKFAIQPVSALPTTGISETTVYLLPGGEDADLYTEYIYVNGKWEILGSQRVDLTGYAAESWVIGKLAEYQPKGDYALRSEIPPVPVQSVNGKTGAVQLNAADVGARPVSWTPTAVEVGALPSTYVPPDQTAEQVGADPKGTAASAVSQHNVSDDSHNDIRLELKAIKDRLNAFFDSDDQTLDELSEIVAYITSNKTLIEAITTSKVSVTDIINNLTTNVSNKPLSAAQGVVLKGLIDTVSNSLSGYQPKGDYALKSELPTVPKKVSAFENDTGYLTEHQDISGKLDVNKLPEAINTALAQAKASGEFDGKTPEKYVDYWTDVDQEDIVQQVIAALGTPVFGRVDADNNIILTGELADGTYMLKYEDAEGNVTEIGTINLAPEPTYTNLFDPATASLDTRISGTSRAPKSEMGYVMTAAVPVPEGTIMKGTYDESTPYIAVPSAMWSGSASIIGIRSDNGVYDGFVSAGDSATVVGAWAKIPVYTQWGGTTPIKSVVVSLYVKAANLALSDIQDIEIYYNEIPE